MIIPDKVGPAIASMMHTAPAYWGETELAVNLTVFANLIGALVLGMIVGYERAYQGRAAGMRTFGLICMASCAVVIVCGYPHSWYGSFDGSSRMVDPTRVIQGILSGIGFLGVGVIHRDGYKISGLTTAASIWASSSIGIMVGLGFYAAAILLSILSMLCMACGPSLERRLPARHSFALKIRMKTGVILREDVLHRFAVMHGYEIGEGTVSIAQRAGHQEWEFIATTSGKKRAATMSDMATAFSAFDGMQDYEITGARG